jgi:hypothetical protein
VTQVADPNSEPPDNKGEVEDEIANHDCGAGRLGSDAERLRRRAGPVRVVLLPPVSVLPLIPLTRMWVMR